MRYEKLRDIVKEWNPLDTFLYKLDIEIGKVREIFFDKEPDVETMIEAETNHLRKENESLRELQYPKLIRKKENSNNYICPNIKCNNEIHPVLIEQYRVKFCPECGQRIFLNKRYSGIS